jgi:hypothetical protein
MLSFEAVLGSAAETKAVNETRNDRPGPHTAREAIALRRVCAKASAFPLTRVLLAGHAFEFLATEASELDRSRAGDRGGHLQSHTTSNYRNRF